MAEQTPPDDATQPEADAAWAAQEAAEEEERAPDESGLVGRIGVDGEVLAELARAEAEMTDPAVAGESDDTGAQV